MPKASSNRHSEVKFAFRYAIVDTTHSRELSVDNSPS